MIEVRLHKVLRDRKQKFEIDTVFELEEQGFYALYGPSGAGKSSLLRMLAGLLRPDHGRVSYRGNTWFNSEERVHISPAKRSVAMVFQEDTLFPNMTVVENLRFAQGGKKDEAFIAKLLEDFQLTELRLRKPLTLSGGQKQRAALARAIAQQARFLLLDEPLNALDQETRMEIQDLLRKIHQEYQLTTFLVTHDIQEVFRLSDQVLVMNNGTIQRKGSPESVLIKMPEKSVAIFDGVFLGIEENSPERARVLVQEQVIWFRVNSLQQTTLSRGDLVRLRLDPNTGNLMLIE